MVDWIPLLIYLLATWRVASLFVNEAGPGRMFQHIRELAGIEHDEDGNKFMIPQNFWAELLSCVWCTSLWVGTFWVIFDLLLPLVAVRVGMVFALSAGAILVQSLCIEKG